MPTYKQKKANITLLHFLNYITVWWVVNLISERFVRWFIDLFDSFLWFDSFQRSCLVGQCDFSEICKFPHLPVTLLAPRRFHVRMGSSLIFFYKPSTDEILHIINMIVTVYYRYSYKRPRHTHTQALLYRWGLKWMRQRRNTWQWKGVNGLWDYRMRHTIGNVQARAKRIGRNHWKRSRVSSVGP